MIKTIAILSILTLAAMSTHHVAPSHHRLQSHALHIDEVISQSLRNQVNADPLADEARSTWETRMDIQWRKEKKQALDDLMLSGTQRTSVETQLDRDWVKVKANAWESHKNFAFTLKQVGLGMLIVLSIIMLN